MIPFVYNSFEKGIHGTLGQCQIPLGVEADSDLGFEAAMLWLTWQPIVRDPSPEGPWPGKEARFPEYIATERTQSHNALPGNVLRPPRPLA